MLSAKLQKSKKSKTFMEEGRGAHPNLFYLPFPCMPAVKIPEMRIKTNKDVLCQNIFKTTHWKILTQNNMFIISIL